jgi:hypothetical protein
MQPANPPQQVKSFSLETTENGGAQSTYRIILTRQRESAAAVLPIHSTTIYFIRQEIVIYEYETSTRKHNTYIPKSHDEA